VYNGYREAEGRKHGPGTVAWWKYNEKSRLYEVEHDEGIWLEDQPEGVFHQKRING
jgi:hypothetical protein